MKAVAIYLKMGATAYFLKNEYTNRNQNKKQKITNADSDYACIRGRNGNRVPVHRFVKYDGQRGAERTISKRNTGSRANHMEHPHSQGVGGYNCRSGAVGFRPHYADYSE